MIFVILGTQKFQLNRLLRLLDACIENKRITQEVVAQIGYSDYLPKHFAYYDFFSKADFDKMITDADIIITHSGVGSIITALGVEKKVIVFPRLSKYKEHVDDHQIEIAKAFSKKKFVMYCGEDDDLVDLIENSEDFPFEKYVSHRKKLVTVIQKYLEKQ
ncbi:MAG: glycosyltransferase [Lachnospiraceae bacterium]|nr:glycosyltransferase [Lachnospiraceae bacterium]